MLSGNSAFDCNIVTLYTLQTHYLPDCRHNFRSESPPNILIWYATTYKYGKNSRNILQPIKNAHHHRHTHTSFYVRCFCTFTNITNYVSVEYASQKNALPASVHYNIHSDCIWLCVRINHQMCAARFSGPCRRFFLPSRPNLYVHISEEWRGGRGEHTHTS